MATAKTLDAMVAVFGPFCLAEYKHAVNILDGEFDTHAAALAAGQDVPRHLELVTDVSGRRLIYAEIATGLAKRLNTKCSLPPPRELPDLARILAKLNGRDFTLQNRDDIRKATAELAEAERELQSIGPTAATAEGYAFAGQGSSIRFGLEQELAGLGRVIRERLRRWGSSSTRPEPPQLHEIELDLRALIRALSSVPATGIPCWPMDALVKRWNAAFARVAAASSRLDNLRSDAAIAEQTTAEAFTAAVRDFGGGENQFLADLRQELRSQKRWHESDPQWPELERKRKRLDTIPAELDRTESGTTRHQKLVAEHNALVSDLAELEPAIELRRLAELREVYQQAAAGKADALKAIVDIITAPDSVLPENLRQAIANTRFENAAAQAIAKLSRK
jgi:hypothetical protein